MVPTLASDLKYESLKLGLKRISLNIQNNSENNEIKSKQEELLFIRRHNKFENKGERKLNSSNKQGQTSKCAICDSKMHWAKHCPHRIKTIQLILQKYPNQKVKTLKMFRLP